MTNLPILYSFRRCPYAIRARMAVFYSGFVCDIVEVDLKDKPPQMLELSPKGTVPVLVLAEGQVIEESLEIVEHVLRLNDPDGWADLSDTQLEKCNELITLNDQQFKSWLDKYKYFERFPEHNQQYYRKQCEEIYLAPLEDILTDSSYLLGDKISKADIALMPFVRQFANVDRGWFDASDYNKIKMWLQDLLSSKLFERVMARPSY